MASLVTCCTLWIGGPMGRVERACLRSVMRQGHRLIVYAYDEIGGAPEGVEFVDAEEVLPRSTIIRHGAGSYALFADHFRYKLQALGRGLWVDTDIYCLKPLDFDSPYVFGWQDDQLINPAVLKLPADSPMTAGLLQIFEDRFVPPWLRKHERAAAFERIATTGRAGIEEMPWGTAGPHAITALAKQFGTTGFAQRRQVFYSAHWQHAHWIRDPKISLTRVVKPLTRAIHLWNENIRTFKEEPAPKGSFLDRLHAEGA